MKRTVGTTAILVLLLIAVLFWWATNRGYLGGLPHPFAVNSTASPTTIAHPLDFAKSHFTGGIGAALAVDSKTGSVYIIEPRNGSPAQKAGLLKGDIITQVNGASMKGKKLAQVVDEIRGFAGREVTLTVQRGTTNLDVTLYRESWSGLGIPVAPLPVRPVAPAVPVASPAATVNTNQP